MQNPELKLKKNKKDLSIVLSPVANVSATYPVRKIPATVKTINQPFGRLLFKDIPSLLVNLRSISKLVLHVILSIKAAVMMVAQQKTNPYPCSGKEDFIIRAMVKPMLMASQKIRFQKLSLFSLDSRNPFLFGAVELRDKLSTLLLTNVGTPCLSSFVKSSMANTYNLWFQIYRIIISNLYKFFKQILSLMLVVSLALCSNSAVALVDDKANQQYNEQDLSSLIASAEIEHNIPSGLLFAIAKTESGMKAYALNIGGRAVFLPSISKAQEVLEDKLSSGLTNIDVGVMQVNYRWHSHEFDSLEEMLTPASNINYAAKLLKSLYAQHGTWHKAVRFYHSANSEHHRKYSRKVVMCWLNS